MKIFIVIPVFNSSSYIQNTVHSIGKASCSSGCQVHVHLQDGGSDDSCEKSIKILSEKYSFRFSTLSEASSHAIDSRVNIVTKSRVPDNGMYDALSKAFSSFNLRHYNWITWIGSDDTFSEDAFCRLALISSQMPDIRLLLSSVGVVEEDGSVSTPGCRPFSRHIIASGSADGKCFPHVQQEGSFFRSNLLIQVLKEKPFDGFQYAGDWNLWRIAARYCDPYHLNGPPLAFFHKRKGQKSSNLDSYYSEIEKCQDRAYSHNLAYVNFAKQEVNVVEILPNNSEPIVKLSSWRPQRYYQEKFDGSKLINKTYQSLVRRVAKNQSVAAVQEGSIIAVDKYWQTPAKTEKHAWEKLSKLKISFTKSAYIGFPWATFIDKLNNIRYIDESDQCLNELTEEFNSLRGNNFSMLARVSNCLKVTVCQHILLKRFIWLFKSIGITDIFWTHKVVGENLIDGIRIHAFPLYPVNVLPKLRQKKYSEYEYDFTFIGARANQWYLSETRNHVFDYYSKSSNALVVSREKWHFQKAVYDQQIKSNKFNSSTSKKHLESLVQPDNATKEFLDSLEKSRFILCPSGSGPNSIRLWESIESGCVPVILADTYEPPGDYRIWQKACVIADESLNFIKNLDNLIANISEKQWQSSIQEVSLLDQEYGKNFFITDIIRLLFNFEFTNVPFVNLASWSRSGRFEADSPRVNNGKVSHLEKYLVTKGIFPSTEISKPAISPNSVIQHNPILISNDVKKLFNLCSLNSWSLPIPTSKRKVKYMLLGKHSHRTPLSYALLYGHHQKNDLAEVFSLQEADIIVTGFNIDIPEILSDSSRNVALEKPIVILSEEPLWDITWSGFKSVADLSLRTHNYTSRLGKYAHINHFNSEIFDFDNIPYFLLTDSKYISRYLLRFGNILKLSPRDLLKHWESKKRSCAFIQEYREAGKHNVNFSEINVKSLSAYRCQLAINLKDENCYIEGKGWADDTPRQNLVDWHLDKLSKLNFKHCFVSAIENVHYSSYVTEKIFDAYASCSIPLYYASDQHLIHKIFPGNSFLNMYGLDPKEAAQKVKLFDPDVYFAERYLQDVQRILKLLSDAPVITSEINRVSTQLKDNLLKLL